MARMDRAAANKTEWLKSLVQQFERWDLFGLLGFSKTAIQQGSEHQPMDSDLTGRKLSDRQRVDRRVIAEPPRNCPPPRKILSLVWLASEWATNLSNAN